MLDNPSRGLNYKLETFSDMMLLTWFLQADTFQKSSFNVNVDIQIWQVFKFDAHTLSMAQFRLNRLLDSVAFA
jgi:hypothetical protein